MKKGIVLLITLFFISSISLLILQNLDDSEEFIKNASYDSTLTQLKLTSKNVQDEIINLISKNKDNIDEILEVSSSGIPLNYGYVDINITLEPYDIEKCYLNDINNINDINNKCNVEIIDNISYPYDFINILKKYKKQLSNKQQVDYFINDYKYQTKDANIDKVKEEFGYIKQDGNTTNNYLKCNYNVVVNGTKASCEFVFKIASSTPIYFEYQLYN